MGAATAPMPLIPLPNMQPFQSHRDMYKLYEIRNLQT